MIRLRPSSPKTPDRHSHCGTERRTPVRLNSIEVLPQDLSGAQATAFRFRLPASAFGGLHDACAPARPVATGTRPSNRRDTEDRHPIGPAVTEREAPPDRASRRPPRDGALRRIGTNSPGRHCRLRIPVCDGDPYRDRSGPALPPRGTSPVRWDPQSHSNHRETAGPGTHPPNSNSRRVFTDRYFNGCLAGVSRLVYYQTVQN